MEPHQRALVDQAIRHILTRYDDRHCLLRSTADPRFRSVRDSLAFAGLLLARAAAGRDRKTELGLARLLIDTLLPLQNRVRRDPGRGAFPLVWAPDANRVQIMDPDSREVMGSLLGIFLRDYGHLLGDKRSARMTEAVRLAIRDRNQPAPESTAGAMTAAWLEMEFGDQWRGERLATDVALTGQEQVSQRRFGDAEAYARQLWALGLWQRSRHLHAAVRGLLPPLLDEVVRFAHPGLPELFGAVTTSAHPAGSYPWLGTWLTWHALCGDPLLPKQMNDPLHSTLFVFPALAKLKLDQRDTAERDRPSLPHALDEQHALQEGSRQISGWREKALHIEARNSEVPAANRLPVAGARWKTPDGRSVWMRCRVAKQERATCRKRFIHLQDPGTTIVSVHNMGPGETRMIDNGWWLSGLHFATEGYQMLDAQRSEQGLELKLKPTADRPMLMFSPLD